MFALSINTVFRVTHWHSFTMYKSSTLNLQPFRRQIVIEDRTRLIKCNLDKSLIIWFRLWFVFILRSHFPRIPRWWVYISPRWDRRSCIAPTNNLIISFDCWKLLEDPAHRVPSLVDDAMFLYVTWKSIAVIKEHIISWSFMRSCRKNE